MNLLRRQPQIRRAECNILIYCHFKQLIFRILERQTNPSAHLLQLCLILMDIFAVQQNFTRRRRNNAVQMLNQRGFSRAGMPD